MIKAKIGKFPADTFMDMDQIPGQVYVDHEMV